eukprot:GEMP01009089.1.p1 GENE.GEMP01009089.1~~GEMP01009089.1.p1  ORF type:complete len:1065 (+),score=225.93 GEMP01009089.1:135-3329(+)
MLPSRLAPAVPFDLKRVEAANAAVASTSLNAVDNSVQRLRRSITNWKPLILTAPAHGKSGPAIMPGRPMYVRRNSIPVFIGRHSSVPLPRGGSSDVSSPRSSIPAPLPGEAEGKGNSGTPASTVQRAKSPSTNLVSTAVHSDGSSGFSKSMSAEWERVPSTASSSAGLSLSRLGIQGLRWRPLSVPMRSTSPALERGSTSDSRIHMDAPSARGLLRRDFRARSVPALSRPLSIPPLTAPLGFGGTDVRDLSPGRSLTWSARPMDGVATPRVPVPPDSNPFDRVGTKVNSSTMDPRIQESLEQGQALMFEMQNTRAHLEGQVDAVESMKELRPVGTAPPQVATAPIVVEELPTPSYTPGKLAAEIERQEMEAARASSIASESPLRQLAWEKKDTVSPERLTLKQEDGWASSLVLTEGVSTCKAEVERESGKEDEERRRAKAAVERRSTRKEEGRRSTKADDETRSAIRVEVSNPFYLKKTVFAQYAEAKHKENPPKPIVTQQPQSPEQSTCPSSHDHPECNPAAPIKGTYSDSVIGSETCDVQQSLPPTVQRHSWSQRGTSSRRSGGSLSREDLEKSFLKADRAQALKKQEVEELIQRAIHVEPRFAEERHAGIPRGEEEKVPDAGLSSLSSVPLEPILERESDPESDRPQSPAKQNSATAPMKIQCPQSASIHAVPEEIQDASRAWSGASLPARWRSSAASRSSLSLAPHAVEGPRVRSAQDGGQGTETEYSRGTMIYVRENDDYPLEGGVEEFRNEVILLRNEKRALLKQRESLTHRQRELAEENYKCLLKVEGQAERIETLEAGMLKMQHYLRQLPGTSSITMAQSSIAALIASTMTKQQRSYADATMSEKSIVLPFNHTCLGINLSISADGYSLRRVKGCRQSVAMGMSKLEETDKGYWFQVAVDAHDTSSGWVGGLGLGATLSPETILNKSPEKAWKLPDTFMIGYWGRLFCYGREHHALWEPEELKNGDVVGFLITLSGEIAVFVNSQIEAFIDAGFPVGGKAPIYPVVDVFGSTSAITLIKNPGSPPILPEDRIAQPLTDMRTSDSTPSLARDNSFPL